jgi:hypothetical protein
MLTVFAGKVRKTGFFQKAGFPGNSDKNFGIYYKSQRILTSSDSCSASYHYSYLVEERWVGQAPQGEDIIRLVPLSTIV